MNNIDKGTVIRTVLLFIALLNQVLIAVGKAPVPLNEQQINDTYTVVSTLVTGVVSAWAWIRNNYISKRGLKQKEVLKQNGLTK